MLVILRRALAAILIATSAVAPMTAQAADAKHWGADYMPNVPVVDQDGRTLKFYDDVIKDKIVVVNFIYTVCRDMCPLITARMAQLQDRLGPALGRDFFFVSVSIDPERDTPERLKEYGEAFGVGKGWLLLTGTRGDIDQIRYKLGERTKFLNEHRNEVLLGNDRSGEWARDSAFADLAVLENNLRSMDDEWLNAQSTEPATIAAAGNAAPAGHGSHGAKAIAPGSDLPGQTLFGKTCGSCHTIGKGKRVGPDLAGILQRRPRDWVARYILEPDRMRKEGDATALELAQAYRAVRMPNLAMSSNDIADLMRYLDAKSGPDSSAVAPVASTKASGAQ